MSCSYLPAQQTDILVRARSHASSRPTYKIEKKTRIHLLQGGKKHINMLISKSDAWDSIQAKPVQSQNGSSKVGKGYMILFQAMDQSPRHFSLTPTKGMVLYSTARGGDLILTPNCASYDPPTKSCDPTKIRSQLSLYSSAHHRL